jgi:hypothetical protein
MVSMHGYEVPIDLEALKAMPRPLPGLTAAQRNAAAVRAQMYESSRQGGLNESTPKTGTIKGTKRKLSLSY